MRKFGGYSKNADVHGGVLTLVPKSVSLTDSSQFEIRRVEGRKGDGCPGGEIEYQQLSGQMGEIFLWR